MGIGEEEEGAHSLLSSLLPLLFVLPKMRTTTAAAFVLADIVPSAPNEGCCTRP